MDDWTKRYVKKAIHDFEINKNLMVDEIVGARTNTINDMDAVLGMMKSKLMDRIESDPSKKNVCLFAIKILDMFRNEFEDYNAQRRFKV